MSRRWEEYDSGGAPRRRFGVTMAGNAEEGVLEPRRSVLVVVGGPSSH